MITSLQHHHSFSMAFTSSSLLHPLPRPLHTIHSSLSTSPKPAIARPTPSSRRDFLLFTATTSLTALTLQPANAKDIPLFGIRKKIEKAEELVKEGFENAEKGFESAEKQVIEAEKEIEGAADGGSVGSLAQAGIVVGAEVVGVLAATSVVNGILGPEPKSS